jgi:hypothetical protein
LGARTGAQPEQASQSKCNDQVGLLHDFSLLNVVSCLLLITALMRLYSTGVS